MHNDWVKGQQRGKKVLETALDVPDRPCAW